jgi:SLT domain-containing protein
LFSAFFFMKWVCLARIYFESREERLKRRRELLAQKSKNEANELDDASSAQAIENSGVSSVIIFFTAQNFPFFFLCLLFFLRLD